jgi:translocation and assembly module TamB
MRWVLRGFLLLVFLLVAALAGVCIGLNTAGGRALAEQTINHFAGPDARISGLGGHFPEDIKLAAVSLADKDGVYATAAGVELRWLPLQLLQRKIAVTGLSAASIDVVRQPVAGKASSSGGSGGVPKFRLDVDRLSIADLHVGAALAGEDVTLRVSGATHFADATHGSAQLDATTEDGSAQYHLNAGIDPQRVMLRLKVAEPPDGLLGHFAGPQVKAARCGAVEF